MSNPTNLKLAKWPFFLGDAVLLALAWLIYARDAHLHGWGAVLFVYLGTMGALIAIIPFILEYRAAVKMVETGALVGTLDQIQNVEQIANQISGATAQWQTVQETSAGTAKLAREISERMVTEVNDFKQFMAKASDGEKNTLRLEIEKLRRSEGDFLQIIVRMLDHTYALHQAAVRSGQTGLIDQLAQFQSSCRDVARRIGLVPFEPKADDGFDPQRHQSADSQAMSVTNAKIRATVATGYTYQGQLIRPALVALHDPSAAPVEESEPAEVPTPASTPVASKTPPAGDNIEEPTLL